MSYPDRERCDRSRAAQLEVSASAPLQQDPPTADRPNLEFRETSLSLLDCQRVLTTGQQFVWSDLNAIGIRPASELERQFFNAIDVGDSFQYREHVRLRDRASK